MVALDGSGHTVRPVPRACVQSLPLQFLTRNLQIITQEKKGWFYHRALLFDVNGDGVIDIVTARATPPGSKQQVVCVLACLHRCASRVTRGQGELLALLGPSFANEKVLVSGPDFLFRLCDLSRDGTLQVLAAEFYNKRLT